MLDPRRMPLVRILVFAAAVVAPAPADVPAERLRREIAALGVETDVGLLVVDTATRGVVFSHAPDRLLKPASVMKLVTTAAALEHLPGDFAFTTTVYASGSELWIAGGGDPALGDDRVAGRYDLEWDTAIANWALALKARHGAAFTKLVIDDTIFDQQFRHPRWDPADQHRWYAAPVGGLNLATNCVELFARVEGDTARLRSVPPLPESFFLNRLRAGNSTRIALSRPAVSDVFVAAGHVDRSRKLGTLAARRPGVFAGFALREMLNSRGVAIERDVVRRPLSPAARAGADRVATHRTALDDVIWRANTHSQNLFAECLLKSLAAYGPDGEPTGQPGTWEGGARVVRQVLGALGVDLSHAVLVDGSGLSHANRLTARQVVDLLLAMEQRPTGERFRASLAMAGESGTLRRYRDPPVAQRLRGKTGSLTRVRALAGYLDRRDGQQIAFALMINGPHPTNRDIRRVFAALLGS